MTYELTWFGSIRIMLASPSWSYKTRYLTRATPHEPLGINQLIAKKPSISSKKPAWYNKHPSNLKNKRNKAYKRFLGDQTNLSLKVTYLLCQKEFDVINACLHRSYILSTEKHLKDNSKFFWTYIKLKRNSNGLPSYKYFLNNASTDS